MFKESPVRFFILRTLEAIILLLLFLFAFSLYSQSFAGETHIDKLGITVDAANKNADRIRRYENKKTRYLNTLNNNPVETRTYSGESYSSEF
jgi:hypothetical protein